MPFVALAEHCSICGEEIPGATVYLATDKVTKEKVRICNICVRWPDVCTMCGLPVRNDFLTLSDGRFLCQRDAKSAVLDPGETRRVCAEVKDDLDKLFSRFISFPTNLHVAIVDRVSLLTLFKIPGNDYECPNVLGYFRATTNHHQRTYEINVLSALRLPELKETCAHEYTHAWVFENVSAKRKRTLARDAEEGFCELVGYLLMDSQNEEELKRALLRNDYTHGQINLFVEAEKRFGFNEVVDWMKYGVDAELEKASLGSVRNIEIPRSTSSASSASVVENFNPAPDKILLKGIAWSRSRPLALINNQSFAPGESGKVLVGRTNVAIRCLAVREDSARVQILGSGEELELYLAHSAK